MTKTAACGAAIVLSAILLETRPVAILRVYTNLDAVLVTAALRNFTRPGTVIEVETGEGTGLKARLKQAQRPIDVALVEGVGYLADAFAQGLTTPFQTESLHQEIPYSLRGGSGSWFGVSYVVGGIVTKLDNAPIGRVASVWEFQVPATGGVCLSPASHPRTQVFFADEIRKLGPRADATIRGWVSASEGIRVESESEVLRAVAAGRCLAGFAYSDTLVRSSNSNARQQFTFSWPEDKEGTPILVTGAAMTMHHENYDSVMALLDWIASREGQVAWATATSSFPASRWVAAPSAVAALGRIRADLDTPQPSVAMLGAALELARRVGHK